MRAGRLRNPVELQAVVQAASGGAAGTGMTETFAKVADDWAEIIGRDRGGTYVAEKQIAEGTTHIVVLRWRDDVGSWRYILNGTQRLRVLSSLDPDGRRRELHLLCEELKP
jgi:head-tail adaptor